MVLIDHQQREEAPADPLNDGDQTCDTRFAPI